MCINQKYIKSNPFGAAIVCGLGDGVIDEPLCLQCNDNIHMFCKTCLVKYIGTQKSIWCPICKRSHGSNYMSWNYANDIQTIKGFPMYSAMTQQVTMKCPTDSDNSSCDWTGSLHDYINVHSKECCNVVTLCNFCWAFVSRKDMNEHSNVCPNAELTCDACNEKYLRKDIDKHDANAIYTCDQCCETFQKCTQHLHKDTCKKRECVCQCGATYIFAEELEHKQTCPKEFVVCTNCTKTVTREKLNEHFISYLCPHCSMLMSGCGKEGHSEVCAEKPITCKYTSCGLIIEKKEYNNHIIPHIFDFVNVCNENFAKLNDRLNELIETVGDM